MATRHNAVVRVSFEELGALLGLDEVHDVCVTADDRDRARFSVYTRLPGLPEPEAGAVTLALLPRDVREHWEARHAD